MMNDPMADLSGPTPATQDEMNNTKEVFDPMAMQVNMGRIERIRSVMGIVSGCVAGITGLTNLQGLGEYIMMI
jgi:EMC6